MKAVAEIKNSCHSCKITGYKSQLAKQLILPKVNQVIYLKSEIEMYILDSKGQWHYNAVFGPPLSGQNGNFPCEIKWEDGG